MFHTICPNRWLLWCITIIFIVFGVVWWQIELYSLEQSQTSVQEYQPRSREVEEVSLTMLDKVLDTGNGATQDEGPLAKKTLSEGRYYELKIEDGCVYPPACAVKLVEKAADGGTKIVLDNILDVFYTQIPSAVEKDLQLRYVFPDRSKIIFKDDFGSSACCQLYSFDVNTRKFTSMSNGRLASMVGDSVSPDGRYVVRLDPDGKKFLATDVTRDDSRIIVEVGEKESLVNYSGAYASQWLPSYKWINNTTIEYGVFDGTIEPKEEQPRVPIDVRTFTFPLN